MPYYANTGGDITALLVGILSIILLIIVSSTLITKECFDKKVQKYLYLMLLIQIIIIIVDNYIRVFPLLEYDPRAFEGLGWYSYENNVNIGRGIYNTLIINPIYKMIGIRSATIFGVINVFANLLTNLNMYKILVKLKIDLKIRRFLLFISILSPISLIFKSGILREAIIIMFVSYSLKYFIDYIISGNNKEILKSFIFIGIGSIFHSGVIFLASGYFFGLLSGKKNQKVYQILTIIITILLFIIFKDKLLEKLGGGDIDRIIVANNYTSLKEASSGYLKNISTTSLGQIVIYLPLFIFYFLYSPTPDMIRGVMDIVTFLLNSSIYIYLTLTIIFFYKKIKKRLNLKEKMIIKSLIIGTLFTISVFSIGTRNAGTAIRHRDKIVLPLIIVSGIIQNKYLIEKENRRDKNGKTN